MGSLLFKKEMASTRIEHSPLWKQSHDQKLATFHYTMLAYTTDANWYIISVTALCILKHAQAFSAHTRPFSNCRSHVFVTHLTSHSSLSTTTIVQHHNPIATHHPPIATTNNHPECPKPMPTPLQRAVAMPTSLRPCPKCPTRGHT